MGGQTRLPGHCHRIYQCQSDREPENAPAPAEVEQRKAEANMLREQAEGEADAIRKRAQAEADAIKLRGEALRQNPNVMELEAINKWNGQLPQYMTEGPILRLSR